MKKLLKEHDDLLRKAHEVKEKIKEIETSAFGLLMQELKARYDNKDPEAMQMVYSLVSAAKKGVKDKEIKEYFADIEENAAKKESAPNF